MKKKKTCKEIHPNSKINIGFTCCNDAFNEFWQKNYSLEELLEIIEESTSWLSLGLDEFTMYGIKRDNQFEGYGRATESNEIPYHAFITKEYCGEKRGYSSGDFKTFKGALIWLAFHLKKLKAEQK